MSEFRAREYLLVHYGEIALKGENRSLFINSLRRNILARLSGLDVKPDRKRSGRLVFRLGPSTRWEEVERRLQTVFGIAYFSRAWSVPLRLEALEEAVLARLPRREDISFAVRTRRANKKFPYTSMDIDRKLGAAVQQAANWRVHLSLPDLTIEVEVLFQEIFFYFDRTPGARGLPVGSSGTVINLLSGGIDSPVAAWYMLKRGCRVINVHFHGAPLTSRASEVKAIELARILSEWGGSAKLYSIPIGQIQVEIMHSSPSAYRVVLYRRLMIRVAQEIAAREHAVALSTGESLAQVASQTLKNLRVIEQAADIPILRPLIGMDKEEIIVRARQIGTLTISNLSGEDCCTLFIPKHPATGARLQSILEVETQQPWREWVAQAVADASVIDVHTSSVDVLQHYPDLLEKMSV